MLVLVQRHKWMKYYTIRRLLDRRASHRVFTTTNSDNTSTSYSVEDCPHRRFAKSYPDAARCVLSVPVPSYVGNNNPILRDEKLENYLQWRGWDIERILHDYGCDDLEKLNYSAAVGLLSHPLTFPLTLGRHISHMMYSNKSTNVGGMMKQMNNLRICCVGARAECTLPDDFWRELLYSVQYFDNQMANDDCQQGENSSSTKQSFDFFIDFVGPDVPKGVKSKTIQLSDNDDGKSNQQEQQHSNNKHTLTLNYHTSFLHEVILNLLKSFHDETENGSDINIEVPLGERRVLFNQFKSKLGEYWDGYVLFNPGVGHTNLQKQWEPTLKYLFFARKPILLTAHSDIDARRDSAVLEKLLYNDDTHDRSNDGCRVEYTVNPYASKMGFVDPFATTSSVGVDEGKKAHIVRPNHSFFMVKI